MDQNLNAKDFAFNQVPAARRDGGERDESSGLFFSRQRGGHLCRCGVMRERLAVAGGRAQRRNPRGRGEACGKPACAYERGSERQSRTEGRDQQNEEDEEEGGLGSVRIRRSWSSIPCSALRSRFHCLCRCVAMARMTTDLNCRTSFRILRHAELSALRPHGCNSKRSRSEPGGGSGAGSGSGGWQWVRRWRRG